MKGFFDNNIEPFIATAINALVSRNGDEAVALREKFPAATSDIDWISALGKEGGWIIFSFDQRILKNPIERAALYDAKLTAFFLRSGVQRQTALERAATILWHWDQLRRFTSMQSQGLYWLPVNKSSKYAQIRI